MSSNLTDIERLDTIEHNLNHRGFDFAAAELDAFLSTLKDSDEELADKVLNIKLQLLIGQGKFEELENTIGQINAKSPETTVRCLISKGILYHRKTDYQTSLIHFLEAESKARELDNSLLLAQVQINIGTVYAGLHHYEEGLDRYAHVLDNYYSILSEPTQVALLHNLGNLNYAIGDIPASIKCLKSSIDLNNADIVDRSRLLLLRSQLAIDPASNISAQSAINVGHDLYPIWLYCRSFREPNDKRLQTLEEVCRLARQGNDFTTEMNALAKIVNIHQKSSNWELAFTVMEKLRALEGALLAKQQTARLTEQAARYELAEKEQSISMLKKEQALQDEIVKRNELLESANEELRQFAYVVSHDLKEPLRMIGAYTQIIASVAKVDEEHKEYFGYIKGGVERLNVLLDGLSNFATLKSLQEEHEVQKLNSIIGTAIENLDILIHETECQIYLPEGNIDVNGSNVLLVLLFQNLIQNAIKFRKENQSVQVKISANQEPDRTIIEVSDNGKGIAKNQRDRIFIIFQRLSRKDVEGSGMGLAICRKIVQLHEGRIYVKETSDEQGTTFCIELPN